MHSQACHCSSFSALQSQLLWRPSSLRRISGCFKRPPPDNSSLNRTRRCQLHAPCPSSPLLACSAPASACARACLPRCVPDATRTTRSRVACLACSACALALPGACPLSRRPFPNRRSLARHRAPSSCSTPRSMARRPCCAQASCTPRRTDEMSVTVAVGGSGSAS